MSLKERVRELENEVNMLKGQLRVSSMVYGPTDLYSPFVNIPFKDDEWQTCLHDSCNECNGTGYKSDGSPCVHMISCPCPKCSPQ